MDLDLKGIAKQVSNVSLVKPLSGLSATQKKLLTQEGKKVL